MMEDIDQKLLTRFEIIQKVKKVSGGVIWKAIDRKSNIAIKKTDYSAKPLNLIKSMRETVVLQEIEKHHNILQVLQVINQGDDQYTIYEFVEMDLISLIKVNILEINHIQVILCNIISALHFIHKAGLVHLGLTPSKILVDSECQVKLIGFGFSQTIPVKEIKYTSLHYLAPEILLQGVVTQSSDIWSLGCIFGEMLYRHPLFTGNSTFTQIEKIVELVGKPFNTNLSELAPYVLQGIQSDKKKSFSSISSDEKAIDLLKKMLAFDPSERITLLEMTTHAFLKDFKINLRQPQGQINLEDHSLKVFETILREKGKKQEPTSQNNSFIQQIETTKKKSFRESTPMSALKQKTITKIKLSSPQQSPMQKMHQIDEKPK